MVAVVASLVVTAVPAGVAAIPSAAATPATTVSSCGTITESGTYALSEDIANAPDDGCLIVRESNVVINGHGHTIASNDGTGPAILVENAEQVTVENVVLADWRTGVAFRNVDGGAVVSTTVTEASVTGISLTGGTNDVTVENASVSTGQTGVRFAGAGEGNAVLRSAFANLSTGVAAGTDDTRIVDNELTDVDTGVHIAAARSVVVAENTLERSVFGVVVERSGDVTVRDNVLRETLSTAIQVADGVTPADPSRYLASPAAATYYRVNMLEPTEDVGHRVTNNTVVGGNDFGIRVVDTAEASVWANTVTDTTDGIYLHEVDGVHVTQNVVTRSGDDGIVVANGTDNALAANAVSKSGDDGIYVVGSDNAVTNNTVTWNGDDGVDVQDGAENRIVANVVEDNEDDGIYLRNAHNTTVTDNRVEWNRDDGVDLRSASGNVVQQNQFCANTEAYVVQRQGSRNNDVWNNSVC